MVKVDTIIHQAPAEATILSESDIKLLAGLDNYRQDIHDECLHLLTTTNAECEALLTAAELKCQEMQRKAEEEIAALRNQLSQELRQENHQLLKEFFQLVEENIFELVYKVLNKLHLNQFKHEQLSSLIKNQLIDLLSGQGISITASSANLPRIQAELAGHGRQINFKIDESLNFNQCKIADGCTEIYIDIDRCQEEILEMLRNPLNEDI